jgi:hypothetical protein
MKVLKKKTKKSITPKSFSKSVKTPSKIKQVGVVSILILGIALIPGSILLSSFIHEEIEKGLGEQVLIPTSPGTNVISFMRNDYLGAPEEHKTYYLWNLTNPDSYLAGDETAIYEEVGPFKFRNYKYKYNVSYNPILTEVTYKEYNKYVQVAGKNISEVYIVNINPAFLGGIALAGGTERKYLEMNFPFVLSQLKETFKATYIETINEQLDNETWIEQTQRDILSDSEVLLEVLGFIPANWLADLMDMNVPDTFFDCLEVSELQTFLRDGMPNWEKVFYAEWANDSFPAFNGNYSYLEDNIEYTGDMNFLGLDEDIEALIAQILADNDIQYYQNELIRKQGAELVDQAGSASGIGIDIEYKLTGKSMGSESDLNMTTTNFNQDGQYVEEFWRNAVPLLLNMGTEMVLDKYEVVGATGITFSQCEALWNTSDPLSLTGINYQENQIWFDALYNDKRGQSARQTLSSHFEITNNQLQYILEWINTSISTWVANAVEYQLNEWNSGIITNRTVEEWLFEANDTAVNNFMNYYDEDTSIACVNLFDNCQNEREAEEADIKTITVMTGKNNMHLAHQVVRYDGKPTIDIWEQTKNIKGSLGMYNSPGMTEIVPPKIFNSDLMRVIDLMYVCPTSIYGVKLNRFTFAPNTFAPNNNYYMNTQGLINVQPVEKFQGVPVLISKPHFLDSHQKIRDSIVGVNPKRNAHDTVIDIEPISGVTMYAQERIQVNFNLSADDYFTKGINTTVMPITWYERSGVVPKHLADKFTEQVYPAQTAETAIIFGGLTLGVVFGIAGGSGTLNNEVKKSIIKKRIAPKSKRKLKKNINSLKSKMGYTRKKKSLKKKENIRTKKPKKQIKTNKES